MIRMIIAQMIFVTLVVVIAISVYHHMTPKIVTADISALVKEYTLKDLHQDKQLLSNYIANLDKLCADIAKYNNLIIIVKQASIAGDLEDITPLLRQGMAK